MGMPRVALVPGLVPVVVIVVVGARHDGLPYKLEENPPSGLRTETIPSA